MQCANPKCEQELAPDHHPRRRYCSDACGAATWERDRQARRRQARAVALALAPARYCAAPGCGERTFTKAGFCSKRCYVRTWGQTATGKASAKAKAAKRGRLVERLHTHCQGDRCSRKLAGKRLNAKYCSGLCQQRASGARRRLRAAVLPAKRVSLFRRLFRRKAAA